MHTLLLAILVILDRVQGRMYAPPRQDLWLWMTGPPQREPKMLFLAYSMIWGVAPPHEIVTDVGMCEVTEDHSRINEADVAWFHWPSTSPPGVRRPKGALWTYFSMESPGYSSNRNDHAAREMNDDINMICTSDQMSEISATYGYVIPRIPPLDFIDTGVRTKTKLIVAVISNCGSSYRSKRIDTLLKLLPIDIMGGSCSTVPTIPECGRGNPNCFPTLGKMYKYYLAIENNDCSDYITEKSWMNAFQNMMVPLVWGKHANYTANLPEHSFINVADFRTPKQAADHVLQTDVDNDLYDTYHAWRKEWVEGFDKGALWKTCKYALLNNRKEKPPINIAAIRDVDTKCAERN